MKKEKNWLIGWILFSLLFLGVSSHALAASPIAVVVPNGGEDWRQLSSQTIRWKYSGSPGTAVKIELLKGGAINQVITSATPIGNGGKGSYNFTIPATQPPGTDYQIRVTSLSNKALTDTSEKIFSISPSNLWLPTTNNPTTKGVASTLTSGGGSTVPGGDSEFLRCSFDGILSCNQLPDGSLINPVQDEPYPVYCEGQKNRALYAGNIAYDFWDEAQKGMNIIWRDNIGSIQPVKGQNIEGNSPRASVVIADAFSLGPGGSVLTRSSDNNPHERAFFLYPSVPSNNQDGFAHGEFPIQMPNYPDSVLRFETNLGLSWLTPESRGPWKARFRLGARMTPNDPIQWLQDQVLSYAEGIKSFHFDLPKSYAGSLVYFVLRVETAGTLPSDRTGDRFLIINPTIKTYKLGAITPGSVSAVKYPVLAYDRPPQFTSAIGRKGSLSLWIRPAIDAAIGDSQVIFHMIRVENETMDPTNRLTLLIRDGNKLEFGGWCPADGGTCQQITLEMLDQDVPSGKYEGVAGHSKWEKGQWHQIITVWSDQDGMSLYLDGGLVAKNKDFINRFKDDGIPSRFYVGSHYTGTYPFNGLIDDLRFFGKALTDWEVQQIFKKDYYDPESPVGGTADISLSGFGNAGLVIPHAIAGAKGTVSLNYTVPQGQTIAAGGGVKIIRKLGNGNFEWQSVQTASIDLPGYATANLILAPDGAGGYKNKSNPEGGLKCSSNFRLGSAYDCFYTLTNGVLLPGDQIQYNLGAGSKGLLQAGSSAAEVPNTLFTVAVNPGGSRGGYYYELPSSTQPRVRVTSSVGVSAVKRLVAIVPSNAPISGELSLVVVAEDQFRNPVIDYGGVVSIYLDNSTTPLASHRFVPFNDWFSTPDLGHHRFNFPVNFGSAGPRVFRITDGATTTYSNIIYVSDSSEYKLYWGDLHGHSQTSDGFISIRDTYAFMREVANLDFAAMSDHIDDPGDVYNSMDFGNFPSLADWQDMINAANERQVPGKFVTFPGYEYSHGQSSNVLPCLRRNLSLTKDQGDVCGGGEPDRVQDPQNYAFYWSEPCKKYRAYWSSAWPSKTNKNSWTCLDYPEIENISCPEFDGDWNIYFSGNNMEASSTIWTPNSFRELLSQARNWEGNGNSGQVLIVPHHGGRQANMDLITPDVAPSLIPAAEITSAHISAPCSFETWAQRSLKNGVKIGFLASSDNHSGTPGGTPGGYIGVWAKNLSREEIFSAIKARRIVAASRGDRPYIKTTLRLGTQSALMGEEITIPRGSSPTFEIEVGSIGGVDRVQIIQDEQVAAEYGAMADSFFKLIYPKDFPGRTLNFNIDSRIYVKVTQKPEGISPYAEGVAWSSPIFVAVQGADPCRTEVAADHWKGEYSNNKGFSENPSMVRDDGTGFLTFDWGSGSPNTSCGMGVDNFSVRWIRNVNFASGNYQFILTGDDGVRFWIDGQLKLDKWIDQPPTAYTVGPVYLSGIHTLKMEYYENAGGAVAHLSWRMISEPPGSGLLATGWEDGEPQGFSNRVEYSKDVSNAQCTRQAGNSHNGSFSLMMAGNSQASYAYAYHRVFDLNLAVSSGMKIGYWIKHLQGTPKIAVDGHFIDGNTIRDFNGQSLKDQNGVAIHPALRQDAMGQWIYVEVDLSSAAGNTLDYIMFAFDNGGDGFTGPYLTYVDDFRIFTSSSPPPPTPPGNCQVGVQGNHWKGDYYDNKDLRGYPSMVRDDEAGFINFDWGPGSPSETCGIGVDNFSARWTRTVNFSAGDYQFIATADDGIRLWIDDQLKLDKWIDQPPTTYKVGPISLAAGNHTLRVEYYENGGGSAAKLSWHELDASPAAKTILFETGWEDGQELGFADRVEYSKDVAGYNNSSNPPPEGSRRPGALRNGTYYLLIAGSSRAPTAYCYYRLLDLNIPIMNGTKLSYWIYHAQGNPKISVDGIFNDGNTIRDFGGGILKDQNGIKIHPAARKDPMNQWIYVEVDLSPAAGKSLKSVMFAFDNGGDGFTGQYRAYVDDLRILSSAPPACNTWIEYVPLRERKAGRLVKNTGEIMSQWATRPIDPTKTDIVWGDPANWPPDGAEENEIKEYNGQTFIWLNAYRNDKLGHRYAVRTTKAIVIDGAGSYDLINAEEPGVEGQPIAFYNLCGASYTLKVWGNIYNNDGSRARRFYWAHTVTPNQIVTNPLWHGGGENTRQAVRQSELWWDSDNDWVIGSGNLQGNCLDCGNLSACLKNCNERYPNNSSDEYNQCLRNCHVVDDHKCTNSSCWPNDTDASIRYGRTLTNAREIGLAWTYDDMDHDIHGGLENGWPW